MGVTNQYNLIIIIFFLIAFVFIEGPLSLSIYPESLSDQRNEIFVPAPGFTYNCTKLRNVVSSLKYYAEFLPSNINTTYVSNHFCLNQGRLGISTHNFKTYRKNYLFPVFPICVKQTGPIWLNFFFICMNVSLAKGLTAVSFKLIRKSVCSSFLGPLPPSLPTSEC